MFGAFANQDGYRFRNLAVGSCPPIFGDPKAFVSAQRLPDCRDSSAVARQAINDFKTVVISANWLSYQNHSDQFLDAFFATVKTLEKEQRQVILIGKAPVFDHYDRCCQEKSLSYPLLTCPAFTSPLTEDVARVNAKLNAFAERFANVKYFDAAHYLCPHGACSAFDQSGRPSYYDASHLSMPASWALGKRILQQGGVPPPFDLIAPK